MSNKIKLKVVNRQFVVYSHQYDSCDANHVVFYSLDSKNNPYSHQFRIHTISPSMTFLIFWSGSFAVQYGHYMRSVVICGPIWGPFAVLRSFADLHMTKLRATQVSRKRKAFHNMGKSLLIYNKIKHSNLTVYDKLTFNCIYLST